MSANAEIKHSVALFAIAVGGAALLVTAVMVFVAIDSGKQMWFGCSAVSGLIGLFQIRRGLKLRNKAVAEGADMTEFNTDLATGQTSRTETRKPSFLDRKKKPEEE
jgi:hypothetical protein